MTHETIESRSVGEAVTVEQSTRRSRLLSAIGATVLSVSLVAAGVASYKYVTRETPPCGLKSSDIDPSKSSSSNGSVVLPDGKKMNISVSAYEVREKKAGGGETTVPMVEISLGGHDRYGTQTSVIHNDKGPEAAFNLGDGVTFFADATDTNINTWCSEKK